MSAIPYQIIDTVPGHIHALSESLRAGDRHEITCAGLSPRKALWRSYKGSIIRRTAIIDGEVGACWGIGGGFMGPTGQPWLMTSAAVEKVPISFAREARKEVRAMLDLFPKLEGYVTASYGQACGFLRFLGFTLSNPVEVGPDRELFYTYRMER